MLTYTSPLTCIAFSLLSAVPGHVPGGLDKLDQPGCGAHHATTSRFRTADPGRAEPVGDQ
ncbi:MAG TPA: hypothetical protein VFD59_11885 [Nocardioidaceae bacterium]|nr:hypothetical protein [Nocardioidaceae bacterium]